jgi:hypothetical protein
MDILLALQAPGAWQSRQFLLQGLADLQQTHFLKRRSKELDSDGHSGVFTQTAGKAESGKTG